jgi:NAD-dependent DNA ligase
MNARNCVAGLINSKTNNIDQIKLIDFISYSVIYPKLKISKQYKLLKELKINVVNHIKRDSINVDDMIEYFKKRRNDNEYDIDGIVIYDNSKIYEIPKDGNPKYGVAFKSIQKDQCVITEVLDVEWNVSRFNVLKPKIKIKPVHILGTEINYATAHNAKFIVDNVIGKGSIIRIIRSGDVIPKINEVLSPAKNNKPLMPTIKYKWNETNVDIIVDEENQTDESYQETNRTMVIKQLTNTMKVLKVKYFSEGYIARLVDENIDTLIKIINIKDEKLENIIGENMGYKIYNNLIDALQTTKLSNIMSASNSFDKGIGLKRIKLIIKNIPDIITNNYSKIELYNKIILINSFNDITTNIFINGFFEFKKYFNKLLTKQDKVDLNYLIKPTKIDKIIENINNEFTGKNIVLTGFRDKKIQEYIEGNGGNISSNVSKNTYLIICKDKNDKSSKIIKAKELNIIIITKDKFYNKYFM